MSWIRLDDDYINHPKFTALSDRAFRLWHEGMAYCRKLMTDGLIRLSAVRTFRYATKAAVDELLTPPSEGVAALWRKDAEGYRVHDYLDWNESQREEQQDREAAKHRMRAFRGKQKGPPVTPHVTPSVTANVLHTVTPHVPGQGQERVIRSERECEGKPDTAEQLQLRAGSFLQRYAELFYQHRHGAKYHNRMHLDFPKACELVQTWTDDARLEKLATIVLTTNDEWISGTDRGFAVFVSRASWADARLAEWEKNGGGS